MERVEMALKSSSRKDLAMKLSPPAFIDELLAVSVQNAVSAAADDFSVDDLLDLPNDDETFVEEETHEEENQLDRPEGSPVSSDEPQDEENALRQTTDFSAGEDFSVPAEDLADLEWLSHFVEDSFSERSTPSLMSEKPSWITGIRKQPEAPAADDSCFKSPVPAKARTKRARTAAGSVWFLGSTTLTDSSSSSSSTSSTSSPSSPWLFAGESELLERPVPAIRSAPAKKSKKKPAVSGHQAPAPRRCSHCGVQKTPQWRAGPMGAKTLCNACGVRYKSGRLLPEYRPACSPNFSSEMHSNSHRKVLEMRRKKENVGEMEQVEPGLNQPVQTRAVVPSF